MRYALVDPVIDQSFAVLSNRINEMRILTVIPTIFTPPTYSVGICGMNFDSQSSR